MVSRKLEQLRKSFLAKIQDEEKSIAQTHLQTTQSAFTMTISQSLHLVSDSG